MPSVREQRDVAINPDKSFFERCGEALQGWAGSIARIDVKVEQREVSNTLVGSRESALFDTRTEYKLRLSATVSGHRNVGGLFERFSKVDDLLMVELRPPTASVEKGMGDSCEVGFTNLQKRGKGSSESFPILHGGILRCDSELNGLARAAVYFKGGIVGGFIGSRTDGVAALKGNPSFSPGGAGPPPVDPSLNLALVRSLGNQLIRYSGISHNLEDPPSKDYTLAVGFPRGISNPGAQTFVCDDGCVGIRATLNDKRKETLFVAIELSSGAVSVRSERKGKAETVVVDQFANVLDAVPFIKGLLEGYRVACPPK